jgi:hypothetical protein
MACWSTGSATDFIIPVPERTVDDLLDLEKHTMGSPMDPCAFSGVEPQACTEGNVVVRLQENQDIRFFT